VAGDAQSGEHTGRRRHARLSTTSHSPAKRGAHDLPTAACCPCGRRRPNDSLALWVRYPNWSNPIVQDPSMFGSKFLFPWQVCLSSKSAWGVCVCIYSLYYKGVRKSKFLTKFAPYVAMIMCHFGLGLTLPSKGKRRGEVLRCWMSGMWVGWAADLSWTGTRAPRCILDEATGRALPWSVHGWHLVLMEAELFGFEAQAGDAVGHVHSLGGRRGPAGAVGGHSAAGREQGGNEAWPTQESPCPTWSCWLPGQTGRSLFDISHKSSQGFSIFMWLDVCGNPSNYAPGGLALSFWMRWLDAESWEPEGTHATSRAEMWEGSARGQANPLRGPAPLLQPQNAWRQGSLIRGGQGMLRRG